MSKAIEQLKRHEGFRARVYKCTAGANTIGYGYNLDANPLALPRTRITQLLTTGLRKQEAEEMLLFCVQKIRGQLITRFTWFEHLSEPRQAVLINMAFNMGMGTLLEFKGTLHAISVFDFDMAARGMLNSRWAKQVHGRATELALQMQTGEFANGA